MIYALCSTLYFYYDYATKEILQWVSNRLLRLLRLVELVYATSFSSWVTYTMATQEECDARATLECLTTKVDALIVQMESALASDPVPTSAL